MSTRRRVVVTGLGGVTGLGLDLPGTWEGLVSGRSGVARITRFDPEPFDTQIAAEVKGYNPEAYFPRVESKKLDLVQQYALVACAEAIRHAGIEPPTDRPERVAVILGTGIGGISELESQDRVYLQRGPSRLSPFFIPKMMANAIAGQISIKYGFMGSCFITASACASAAHALGLALRTIQHDEADIVISGGSEATITELSVGGFCALKALSRRNAEPTRASRPFDIDRDGFVMGEGAAVLIFEEYEHARARGATIYAEVKGYGSTADAYHITAPREDAEGPRRAMEIAMRDAGVAPGEIDYINAHGTSTQYNDEIETLAVKKAFGDQAKRLAISSTKSMLGHLLGASGAIELAVTVLSIQQRVVHPTINLENPDPKCDLDYVPRSARDLIIRNAMSNSLGFGGHNVSLVVGRL
ncbi:MAG: beta-ketoacyl-ACP synthase II [Planctomycetota bacterium]